MSPLRRMAAFTRAALTRRFFRIYEIAAGLPISRFMKSLDRTQWMPPDQVKELQRVKLAEHLAYAFEHSPYWRRMLGDHGYAADVDPFEFLARIPILDKGGLRRHMPEILVPDFRGRRHRTRSGGSTGEPVVMWEDSDTYALLKANLFRKWEWAGYRIGEPWLWVKGVRRDATRMKVQDWAFNCDYLCFKGLSREEVLGWARRFQGREFAMIRGNTGGMSVIARTLLREGISGIRAPIAVTTGETLFPSDREAIEQAFGCRVFDEYGGDVFSIAGQCDHGNYHLCDESVHVTLVDDADRPVRCGERGHVILSEFHNRLMPLFRYRIGDMATAKAGLCSCGRGLSMLKSIDGRDSDIVVLPNGVNLVVNHLADVPETVEGIDQYQIIQEEPDRLRILLKTGTSYDRATAESAFRAEIRRVAECELRIEFEYTDAIPLTPLGKRRFVISRIVERSRQGLPG